MTQENDSPVFSFAICLPPEADMAVSGHKKNLFKEIGWFSSRNSQGHITFNGFGAHERKLQVIERYAKSFCEQITPFSVSFDSLSAYPSSGALCLSPEKESKKHLEKLMRLFNKNFPLKKGPSNDPHITIAKELDQEKLQIASKLAKAGFSGLQFNCNAIHLRKLDRNGQYFIIRTFPLKGTDPSGFGSPQLSLWPTD